jgi:hypothetical protein
VAIILAEHQTPHPPKQDQKDAEMKKTTFFNVAF